MHRQVKALWYDNYLFNYKIRKVKMNIFTFPYACRIYMTNQKHIEIFHHLINPQLYIRISV